MFKKLSFLAATAAVVLLSFGCEKRYEEGPLISLRSPEERVENTWVIEKALDGDEDKTSDYNNYEIRFSKDGDVEVSYEFFNTDIESEGKWEFRDNKSKIFLNFDDDDLDQLYDILKLKEDEFWVIEDDGDCELRLEPK